MTRLCFFVAVAPTPLRPTKSSNVVLPESTRRARLQCKLLHWPVTEARGKKRHNNRVSCILCDCGAYHGGISVRSHASTILAPLVFFSRRLCIRSRGISLAQDSRFKSADKKLLAKMKFAPELDQKVDLNKVEISALHAPLSYRPPVSCIHFMCRDCCLHQLFVVSFRVWVAQRITSILGFEDEVVVELVFGHLEVQDRVFHQNLRTLCNCLSFWLTCRPSCRLPRSKAVMSQTSIQKICRYS